MSDLLAVKVAATTPAGATAVGEFVHSDRMNRIDGVGKVAAGRAGFSGEVGTVMSMHDGERTRVLIGLGRSSEIEPDALSRATAAFVRSVSKHRRVALLAPDLDWDADLVAGDLAEAAALAGYRFTDLKSDRDRDSGSQLGSLTLVTDGDLRMARTAVAEAAAVADAVCFARDLVNLPGGELIPERFASLCAQRAESAGLVAEVFDERAIAEMGLGGVLAVNKGSSNPPRLVKLTYSPQTDANGGAEELPGPVALVGKGITFDSGGLSLKPAEAMVGMKMDMAGGAAVTAAMCALPAIGAPVEVIAFVPMTDNMTGPDAQRPGDVYTARNGTTVEVLNTDAEGRLILGDALALASEEQPVAILDLATLTGACVVALGERVAGLMSNDYTLSMRVSEAADAAGERVWALPLPEDYAEQLDSEVADVKNIGTKHGGALTAGLFLRRFVGEGIPWAHLDIAGPAFAEEAYGVNPKGGTGFGVRTLLSLLGGWGIEEIEDIDDIHES